VFRGDGGKLKREIGRLVLGCAAGALLVTSALQWLSWHWLSQSQRYVADLSVTGWIADEQAWHRHREALEARRDLVPLSANVYWQLGELHRWRAMGMRLWPEQQRQEQAAAKQHYIEAVVRSPFNGELLARVADRLAHSGDPLAVSILERALYVAPYEPVAQYHLVGVGLLFWDELDSNVQDVLETMLIHAMANNKLAADIRQIASNHGRLELVDSLARKGG
jgi:hypothetical protein